MSDPDFPLPTPPQTLRSSQWQDVALWLLRRRQRLRVTGDSMLPLLQPGEEVLINPAAYRGDFPKPGDLVIAQHPQQPNLSLIKWVVYGEDGSYFLKGINTEVSSDSRSFGLVPESHILGQVVCRFP